MEDALQEFREISETAAGPTRGNRTIDRTFTNFESIKRAGTLNPLQTDDTVQAKESDHRICYLTQSVRRKERYRWLSYTYRYSNEDSDRLFGEWLAGKDWAELVQTPTSDAKAEMYQRDINEAIEACFPLRTTKRRSIDPPWINPAVKKLIKGRKRVFMETDGRTSEWKEVKKKMGDLIKKRCKKFQTNQKSKLLANDGDRVFFKQTKNYLSKQWPKPFEVLDMFPGQSEQEVADHLEAHFNEISNDFTPLNFATDIPHAKNEPLKDLLPHEVSIRLKKIKKPKSMVRGDIFPALVTRYADLLAVPLTSIYNEISCTKKWPKIWKKESVTVIPKTRTPTEIGQLRNISCTMLASKVYESFVLGWTLEQVKLKDNQFGGSDDSSESSSDASDGLDPQPEHVHSTPLTDDVPFEPDLTPFRRGHDGGRFVFLDKARNVRRALLGSDVTVLRDRTIPEEPNPVTSAIWRPRKTSTHKYIDDSISDTK